MTQHSAKADKILSWLYAVGGVFAVIFYGSYLIKLVIWPEGVLAYTITVAVLAGVCLPVLLRRGLRRWLGKAYLWGKALFVAGLWFYMLSFLAMCVWIFTTSYAAPAPQSLPQDTVFVVFGAKAYSYGPGKTLRLRLDKTAELMQSAPGSVCVVSGGQGADEPTTEAAAMKAYLTQQGIAPNRIYEEDRSHNTRENISFSVALLAQKNMQNYTLACVSSDFHLARIRMMCNAAGVQAVYYPAENTSWYALFTMLVREYMSYTHFFLFGW